MTIGSRCEMLKQKQNNLFDEFSLKFTQNGASQPSGGTKDRTYVYFKSQFEPTRSYAEELQFNCLINASQFAGSTTKTCT